MALPPVIVVAVINGLRGPKENVHEGLMIGSGIDGGVRPVRRDAQRSVRSTPFPSGS
jgi:hypothetical protein